MQSLLADLNKNRFLLGIILNTIFVIVEVFFGFVANSLALLADAVHNACDVLGLGLVWLSYFLAQRQTTNKFTYGFKNATIIAAFINSIILIFAIGNLLWESVLRFATPEPVVPFIVIGVAAVGVLINFGTALLFIHGKDTDLNIKGVYLNMTLDALLSVAVVIGGIFIWLYGWVLIDPIMGIVIGATIIYSVLQLFKESLHLIFQAVPPHIDIQAVIRDITNEPQIIGYHDLHIWALSTTETALSVHIITSDKDFNPVITSKLAKIFQDKYQIQHSTIQLEVAGSDKSCTLRC